MTVYANGLEVACKAQSNKVIAAFPDVCMTPPEAPPTVPGIPVPYPSFGVDSDTDKGTSTVKIGGKTVTQKNKSYYTKTTGTEAGCAAKKSVITSKNTGKEYANAWSNDVKFDGEPVARFSDLATLNHASPTGSSVGTKVAKATRTNSKKSKCLVGSHKDIQAECAKRKPKSEAHHIIPDMIYRASTQKSGLRIPGAPSYSEGMCICITMKQHKGVHRSVNRMLKALGNRRKLTSRARNASHVKGTASVGACQKAACSQLKNIRPPLDSKCIKKATDKAKSQTKGIARQPARTNPQRAPKKNSVLQTVLRRGHF